MIEGVENMNDNLVRVVYNKSHQKGVDYIMENLEDNVIDAFGEEFGDEILGNDIGIVNKFSSEIENQHTERIKSMYTAPPTQSHKLFYGSNNSENLYEKNVSKKSYSSVAKYNPNQPEDDITASQRENDELRQMINELKQRFNAMENKHNTFVQN